MKVYYFENIKVHDVMGSVLKNVYFTKDLFVPSHYVSWLEERKIDATQFWIGPGKVMLDLDFPLTNKSLRHHFVRKYLYKGCSLLISVLDIGRSTEWKREFYAYVHDLQNISIDYMVVPKMDIRYLTADKVRFFGLQGVPFIIVELKNLKDLDNVKWGWIRQMQMTVKIPIATQKNKFSNELLREINKNQVLAIKTSLTTSPLNNEALIETGISPKKGEIRIYGDADFNLYLNKQNDKKEKEYRKIHEKVQLPYISVIRGNMVKLNHTVLDKRGFGQYCRISIPNHF